MKRGERVGGSTGLGALWRNGHAALVLAAGAAQATTTDALAQQVQGASIPSAQSGDTTLRSTGTTVASDIVLITEIQFSDDSATGAALPDAHWCPGENIAPSSRLQPLESWCPASLADGELRIIHREGQALDAIWVREQFIANKLVGHPTTFASIVAMVQLINRAFVDNGYINSGLLLASEETPGGGALRLLLVYGTVSPDTSLEVQWFDERSSGLDADYVLARLPSARERPLDQAHLQRDFRLLADDPAIRTLDANLLPGSAPGQAQVRFVVDPQPRFDLYLDAANSRSPTVGGERYSLGAIVRNLGVSGSVLNAEFGSTDGLSDSTISYVSPLWSPKWRADVRWASDDATLIDPAIRALDIQSQSTALEAGLTYAIVRRPLMPYRDQSRTQSALAISAGARLSAYESDTSLLGVPFSFTPGAVNGHTEVNALRVWGEWTSRSENSAWSFVGTGSLGLNGTGSDVVGVSTPNEHFVAMLVQGSVALRLNDDGLGLRLTGAGQYSNDLLYASERFAVGGAATVRGYRENLLLADTGVFGSVELTQSLSLPWGGRRTLQVGVFVEGAHVWNNDAFDLELDGIAGAGVSLDWTPSPVLSVQLAYAHAFTEVTHSGLDDLQDRGVHFRITFRPLDLF